MRGRDDAAARPLRRKDFLQPQPGHERVEVDDVGTNFAQPAVEMFGAAHGRVALSLVAGGECRHRIRKTTEPSNWYVLGFRTPGSGAATSTSWPQALR